MPKKIILEISVESLPGAQAAERAGAARLELCCDRSAGGLTPDTALMAAVHAGVKLPVFAMIRPRSGGFVYSDAEFAAMKDSIILAKQAGMQGIVLGILSVDHNVDVGRTRQLVELAAPLQVTFNRAFDVCVDLQKTLLDVVQTGAHRILSSGGAFDALKGALTLATLRSAARARLEIVPAMGINPSNITEIARITRAREIHSGLGTVLSYGSEDYTAFENEIRKMVLALSELRK